MTYDPTISANANLAVNGLRSGLREVNTQVRDIIDADGKILYTAGSADDVCRWMERMAKGGDA